jgi:hypothetical protein
MIRSIEIVVYMARILKVTTIRYATGEEKVDWALAWLRAEGDPT